jgi:hypothetical protein
VSTISEQAGGGPEPDAGSWVPWEQIAAWVVVRFGRDDCLLTLEHILCNDHGQDRARAREGARQLIARVSAWPPERLMDTARQYTGPLPPAGTRQCR